MDDVVRQYVLTLRGSVEEVRRLVSAITAHEAVADFRAVTACSTTTYRRCPLAAMLDPQSGHLAPV